MATGCRFRYELLPEMDTTTSGGRPPGGGASGLSANGAVAEGGENVAPGGAESVTTGGERMLPTAGGAGGNETAGAPSAGGPGIESISTTGLVAYWPLDEAAGLVAADASGNGNDGVLFATGSWTAGKVVGALALQGSNYIRVAPSPSVDVIAETNSFTIAAWVSPSSSGGWRTILSVQLGTTSNEVLSLTTLNDMGVIVVNSNGNTNQCSGARAIPLNQWFHLAATYDGRTARLYEDGLESCAIDPVLRDLPVNSNPILLGANQNGTQTAEFFQGLLDEVLLYSRPLTPDEIVRLRAGQ